MTYPSLGTIRVVEVTDPMLALLAREYEEFKEEIICGHRDRDWHTTYTWKYPGAEQDYQKYLKRGVNPQCQISCDIEEKWQHLRYIKTKCELTCDVEEKWQHLSYSACDLACLVSDNPYNRKKNVRKNTLSELKECAVLLGVKIPEDLYYPNWKDTWLEIIDEHLERFQPNP